MEADGRPAPSFCDAGYPKNLSPAARMADAKVFFGGLGQIAGGLRFTPGHSESASIPRCGPMGACSKAWLLFWSAGLSLSPREEGSSLRSGLRSRANFRAAWNLSGAVLQRRWTTRGRC